MAGWLEAFLDVQLQRNMIYEHNYLSTTSSLLVNKIIHVARYQIKTHPSLTAAQKNIVSKPP